MFAPGGVLLPSPEHSRGLLYSEGSMLNDGDEWGNIGSGKV